MTNRATDVVINVRRKEGENAKNTLGLVDNRLFTGENKLHANMDTQTCLWSLKYDSGTLPQSFKGQWTSLNKLLIFVKEYYEKRNIEIVSIED